MKAGSVTVNTNPQSEAALDRMTSLLATRGEDGFLFLDRDQRIVACVGGAEQILGRSQTALMGVRVDSIAGIGDTLCRLIEKSSERGSSVRYFDLQPKGGVSGEKRSLDLEVIPDSDKGFLIVLHPRGQVTPAQSGIKKGQIMANLSAALAHEIRNPLSGIRAAAQLATKSLPNEKQHLTALILDETKRLSTLIDQLEGLTDGPGSDLQAINLHEAVNHVCNLVDGDLAQDTHLRLHFDPSLPPVWGNRDALVQILLNLIRNAEEAAQGAPITINVFTRYHQGVQASDRRGTGVYLPFELEVRDDGPGVDPALEEGLFDPFVTSKEAGRGLGLAIVSYLAGEMGAHLRHERADPTGARFLLNFKRADTLEHSR